MNRLLALVGVGVLTVVALLGLGDPRPAAVSADLPTSLARDDGGLGSTWYCVAAGAGTPSPVAHEVVVSNPTSRDVTALISGSASGSVVPPATSQVVPARSLVTVDAARLGADAGSVTVELFGTGAVVSHRLTFASGFDQVPCLTSTSSSWYFAAADTGRGSAAQLWVYNPFATDTSFDVTVYSSDAVRQPPLLNGVLVAAHSSRLVDIGQSVERREQFALAVVARSGRIVAELAQTSDGSDPTDGSLRREGLRIGQGSTAVHQRVDFADGVVGSGAHERFVLFNPTDTDVNASVHLLPFGADRSTLPEPIVVDVRARRFVVIDLDAESRVEPEVPHSVVVAANDGPGLAVTRLIVMSGGGTGGPDGPGVKSGLASTNGSAVASTRWVIGQLDDPSGGRSVIAVRNTSTTGIAQVTVTGSAAGAETVVVGEGNLEIPPGDSVLIDTAALAAPSVVEVASNQPVVVESRRARTANRDFLVATAIPVAGADSALDASGLPSPAPEPTTVSGPEVTGSEAPVAPAPTSEPSPPST